MALLFSSTLQPQGSSSLAAVRFACPIRIYTVRIFPHGVPFFENARHIKSRTHPEAFYLNVYFNAQPLTADGKGRQRAANALVPTSISYPGGLMDFAVDMGTEYATRLMIVKGSFDQISLAIYGHLVSEKTPVLAYEPKSIVPSEPETLSVHLDPANASDPTTLAKSLLGLIPNAPSLSLAIRLMFCMKPTEDDWDNPDFPHIYANLENDNEDYDLDAIVANLDRPIPEDVNQESLDKFVERLVDLIGPASVDQAYQIANMINLSASQSPLFSKALLNALDLSAIFPATTLQDTSTLTTLTDACSNTLIARHFLSQTSLLDTLNETRENLRARSDRALLSAIDRLKTRILGWKYFDDALSLTTSDWSRAAGLIYDICREEQALGNWFTSMIMHEDILAKFNQSPPSVQRTPPVLFGRDVDDVDEEAGPITHDDFMTFARACIGVIAVLGVLAWADSVGNDDCRERTLAVIHLWQSVDGYREIVNHLFLLRQLTRRLKWITTDNDPPRHSGLLAERVLCSLLLPPVTSSHPLPMPSSSPPSSLPTLPALNTDLTQTILSLSQPLAYIPEHERLGFRKLALVVDDGLPAAVEELAVVFESHHQNGDEGNNSYRPVSLRRLRILRVGVGLVMRELGEDGNVDMVGEDGESGEWRILDAFGVERTYGFTERLVDLFVDLVEDLMLHFSGKNEYLGSGSANSTSSLTTGLGAGVKPTGKPKHQDLIEQLFATTRELLILVHRLVPAFSLTARGLRKIVGGIVDLVGCADFVLRPHSNSTLPNSRKRTDVERVASKSRRTCVRILRAFSARDMAVEPRRCASEIVLRSLLICGQVGTPNIDGIKPEEESTSSANTPSLTQHAKLKEIKIHWAHNVFPLILHELRLFMRVLPVEDQVRLIFLLVDVDEDGVVGIGEWLVEEEIREAGEVLRRVVGLASMHFEDEVEEERRRRKEIKLGKQREREFRRAETMVNQHRVYTSLQFLWLFASSPSPSSSTTTLSSTSSWFLSALAQTPTLTAHLTSFLTFLLDAHYTTPPLLSLFKHFSQPSHFTRLCSDELKVVVLIGFLRIAQGDVTSACVGDEVYDMIKDEGVVRSLASGSEDVDVLRQEVGRLCAICADRIGAVSSQVAEMVIGLLEWMINGCNRSFTSTSNDDTASKEVNTVNKLRILRGVTRESFGFLCDSFIMTFLDKEQTIENIRSNMGIDEDEDFTPISTELPNTLILSLSNISSLLSHSRLGGRPMTPKGTKTPDILGTIISPPTALLRSPAATGLTKTYMNNDFRSLRQVPSARLNTSRLPSRHETGSTVQGAPVSPLIVPVPIPLGEVSALGGFMNMG
ncbi:hypothetical protein AN958_05595 [Leucoagaricus sp. SymC.cos]|nr:hypothetical protein AN958_05595 [Leucoagaricus sp. SymC.cos]